VVQDIRKIHFVPFLCEPSVDESFSVMNGIDFSLGLPTLKASTGF